MDSQDHTALHSAVKAGDLEAAELLLREGIDVYCKDEQGFTPLQILIQKRIEKFKSLHAKGQTEIVDHEVTPKDSKIDIHSAICQEISENEKLVVMLLKHKSSNFNCMPEVQLMNFHAACTLNNPSAAEQLSEQLDVNQSVNADSPVYSGYTALHFAAHCNVNTVKMLVSKGANLLVQDCKGVTPLQICIKSFSLEDVHSILTASSEWRYTLFSDGKTKLVDYIFSLCNADNHKNFLQAMDKDVVLTLSKDSSLWPGYTILHLALTLLPESNLQMILDILNINPNIITMQDAHCSTGVHIAFRQSKLNVVNLLLDYQETGENPLDDDNLSHLHIAAIVDNRPLTAKILKNEVNLDIDYKGEALPLVKLGWTPLHVAVHTEHATIARTLLVRGANFLQTDARGFTAVHQLLGSNNMKKVAKFVFASDQLKERVVENVGLTHLHVAAWYNSSKAIERLLDLGSDIEATIGKFEDEHLKKFEGCRSIHVTTIDQRKPDAFATLLKRGADLFARRFNEPTPLIQVLTDKYPQSYIKPMVEVLWGNEKLQQRMEEETGVTQLHVLCYVCDEEKIGELLQKGVDVNARISNDSTYWPGFTPLHVFVFHRGKDRYEDLCSLLLSRGANVGLADAEGNTPVLLLLNTWSAAHVQEFARYLLEQQRDFSVNPTNKFGMSHFHVACLLNEVEMAEDFLKSSVVNVNQQINLANDDDEFGGKAPLHLALFFKTKNYEKAGLQIDTVNLLLERGADVGAVDAFGRTALHYLAECSGTRIVLLHKFLNTDINKQANDGKTPMEILLSDHAPSNEIFYFLREGARINSYNPISDEGYMAIVLKKYGKKTMDRHNPDYHDILELMMNSSDIDGISNTGRNAIHNAVAVVNEDGYSRHRDYIEAIDILIVLRCDIFQQDNQGRTPLHLAVKFDNGAAVGALLKCGADVNIVDRRGNSPFACAFELCKDKDRWNLDWCIKYDGSYHDVGEILAVHLLKLKFLGLQISELNARLLSEVLSKNNESDGEIHDEIFYALDNRAFFLHLEKAKKDIMHESRFTVYDFLHPTLLVNSYSVLEQVDRDAVDLFFKETAYSRYAELEYFLRFQYNNAQQRPSLIVPAVEGLRQLLGFPVPDLCADIILMELTNLDLKNMIAAVTATE